MKKFEKGCNKDEIIKQSLGLTKCPKCGKYSDEDTIHYYGTCLCGYVFDKKLKFKHDMYTKLNLWKFRDVKSRKRLGIGKYGDR